MQNPLEGDFTYVSGDISKDADRKKLVDTALQINGALDILVNVAGVAPKVRADLLTMTEESYDYVMDINTKGTFFLTQLAATAMIQKESAQNGQQLSIFLLCPRIPARSIAAEYCISKAGVSIDYKAVCRPSGAIRHFGSTRFAPALSPQI